MKEENRALRAIISQCNVVLSNLDYEWTDIAEAVGQETIEYYCQSESNGDLISFKTKVLDWFDESSEFLDCLKNILLKKVLQNLNVYNFAILLKKVYYYGGDSFSNFGAVEFNGKNL